MFTKILTVAILITVMAASAHAGLITFSLEWSGAGNSAVATGMITLDDTLLPNPGSAGAWPGPVAAFQITVSGASAGNGTFGMADFAGWTWETNGGTLDLGTELVGQPTAGDPWGTPSGGAGGDLNFFNAGASPSAPNGEDYFVLVTDNGGGDAMQLTSMAPVTAPIPEPAGLGLMGLALLAMRKRR